MVKLALRSPPSIVSAIAERVLYVGSDIDEIGHLLRSHIGKFDMQYKTKIVDAMQAVRAGNLDVVFVDTRNDPLATKLLIPLMLAHARRSKLVVICKQEDVRANLAVPGVARVLTAPLRESQVLRIIGIETAEKQLPKIDATTEQHKNGPVAAQIAPATVAKPTPRFSFNIFALGMSIISILYKRTAFVLLAALFSAFSFYGLMIVFFLGSSGWAAPLTLVRGHELVVKAEADLTQLQVNYNLAEQRIAESQLAMTQAERDMGNAKLLVQSSIHTITSEIKQRQSRLKAQSGALKRLRKTQAQYENAPKTNLTSPGTLYSKRLIDKKTYESAAVASLEISQRMDAAASESEIMAVDVENLAVSIETLKSLKSNLQGKSLDAPGAVPPDLLLLAKQALDANAEIKATEALISASKKAIITVEGSRKALAAQLSDLKNSPPGRAVEKRIDVLFVPYANLSNFQPGETLVSCRLTILLCAKAGTVGQTLPGESTFTHPFFGKPVRGVFVEVNLTNPDAAAREIIHVKRAPLFF
jgi:hypothetical protein